MVEPAASAIWHIKFQESHILGLGTISTQHIGTYVWTRHIPSKEVLGLGVGRCGKKDGDTPYSVLSPMAKPLYTEASKLF